MLPSTAQWPAMTPSAIKWKIVMLSIVNRSASDRFGMGRVLTFGAFLQCLGYSALLPAPPFALFPVIYALLIGFGLALMMVSRTCILKGAQLTIEYRLKQAHT